MNRNDKIERFLLAVLATGVLLSACSRRPAKTETPVPTLVPTPTPTSGLTPTATAAPTPTPTPTSTPPPTATPTPAVDQQAEVREYLAKVFPPGPGRDDVLLVCTSCHGIQVIILAGPLKDEGSWGYTRDAHEALGVDRGDEKQFALIFEYLIEHFGSDKPPPPPPPALLVTGWQSYL